MVYLCPKLTFSKSIQCHFQSCLNRFWYAQITPVLHVQKCFLWRYPFEVSQGKASLCSPSERLRSRKIQICFYVGSCCLGIEHLSFQMSCWFFCNIEFVFLQYRVLFCVFHSIFGDWGGDEHGSERKMLLSFPAHILDPPLLVLAVANREWQCHSLIEGLPQIQKLSCWAKN